MPAVSGDGCGIEDMRGGGCRGDGEERSMVIHGDR
jgi:hypothetical protein